MRPRYLKHSDVTLQEKNLSDKDYNGLWHPVTREITIREDLSKAAKVTILLHEAMHFAETELKKRNKIERCINHDFIIYSTKLILILLIEVGLIKGITIEEVKQLNDRGFDQ